MEVKLLGALDYNKLKKLLKESNVADVEGLIQKIEQLEKEKRATIVATSGGLSRFPGDVFEVLNKRENQSYESNIKMIKRITKMGHDSITDHDYCVFALKNVSAIIEQIIIAERFSSFTIKSRREVDFSNAGFFVPQFRDEEEKQIPNEDKIRELYIKNEMNLFNTYQKLLQNGVTKEDARFVLPYSYYSNIIMGVDAHTLKNMIIKFTKTKYANIGEVKQFGELLLEIARENIPYIVDDIENAEIQEEDVVEKYLNQWLNYQDYQVLNTPKLLTSTPNVDDHIIISAIMRRYQYDYKTAEKIYQNLSKSYPSFKVDIMNKIAFQSDGQELTQVNFTYQIPTSFAVLTHLTRHRTHDLLIPDFGPSIDLSQYRIPPKLEQENLTTYHEAFQRNQEIFWQLKNNYHIKDEDLIYFTLSGNLVNIISNLDGKTLAHILRLRECNKTQWETRMIVNGMHDEIRNLQGASCFSNILGPTCETQGFCKEGKESC
ncbi:MAG: FAD-dependent thymidylate synthase, partial [Bacilli bacterium]|nr:FAD-dependent thymidylate synthase [Bacilli bacterium]